MNIMQIILEATDEIIFKDEILLNFKNSLKEVLLKIVALDDGFDKEQEELERFLNENILIAREFFKILKGYYLRKIIIEKTGSEREFNLCGHIEMFEKRFLNIDKSI